MGKRQATAALRTLQCVASILFFLLSSGRAYRDPSRCISAELDGEGPACSHFPPFFYIRGKMIYF